jgi:plasmid segregation protein ParM
LSGNVERERAQINGRDAGVTVLDIPGDGKHVIGEAALRLSRFKSRQEDRNWIDSAAYMRYFLAALTELTPANYAEVQLVTGLPVTYFAQDKERLRARLTGDFRVQREGRNWQKFTVSQVAIVPQPFGTLLRETLDNRGCIVNRRLATGRAGVIDIGGKTTGYLSTDNLKEIPPETGSIDVGCWEALTLIRDAVNTEYPGLDLDDHEVAALVSNGATVRYYGDTKDVSEIVNEALAPLAERVIAEATTLWNGAARLDVILVTGGGARLVGPAICEKFPQARIVGDSAFANAQGYFRFAQRQYAQ